MSHPETKPTLTEFFQQTVDEFPGDIEPLGTFSIERAVELIRSDRERAPFSE